MQPPRWEYHHAAHFTDEEIEVRGRVGGHTAEEPKHKPRTSVLRLFLFCTQQEKT